MSKEYLEAFEILLQHIETEADWSDYEKVKNAHKIVEEALQRLEAIDNSNPSEALECLERIDKEYGTIECDDFDNCFNTIKQALLKQQEPKHYLKWEDLEKDRIYKVLLNGRRYELRKWYDDYEYHCDYITLQKNPNDSVFIYEWNKEIFNDLHLERVEE